MNVHSIAWRRRFLQQHLTGQLTEAQEFVELRLSWGVGTGGGYVEVHVGPATIRYTAETDEALFQRVVHLLRSGVGGGEG